MKKFISVILIAVMLATALTIGVGAKGTCMFYDDFSNSFSPQNWMLRGGYDACAYIWDHNNKYLYGMDDAIVLQSNYVDGGKMWKNHYYSIDVRIQEGALGNSDTSNIVMQFQDLFQPGITGPKYSYIIIPQTGEATLEKEFWYTDEDGYEAYSWAIIDKSTTTTPIEIDPDGDWFNIGMRITAGKIQCYFNGILILESEFDPNDTKLGRRFNKNSPDTTVGAFEYPLVFINYDNVLNVDNFQVWTSDYDFTTTSGDVNGDGVANLLDASHYLKYIAGWKDIYTDIHQMDLNCDGSRNISDVTRLLQYIAGWSVTLA